MLPVVSVISDFIGILSFILTIVLLIRSESMRKEIESQRADYKKEQNEIKKRLISLRTNVVEDNLLNMKVISDIRTQLFTFQQKFKRLLSKEDRKHIAETLSILKAGESDIDKGKLCIELDYFVARFERKEKTT